MSLLVAIFVSPIIVILWQIPEFDVSSTPAEKKLLVPGPEIAFSLIVSGIFLMGFMLLTDLFLDSIKIVDFRPRKRKSYPNKGIFNSLNNSIQIGLIFAFLGGLLFGLGSGFVWGFSNGLGLGLIGGELSGIGNGLEHGSATFIPHFALRLVLRLSDLIPWNYRQFLDYADKLRLLKKDGSAYTFYHPSLREYFARMNPDEELRSLGHHP